MSVLLDTLLPGDEDFPSASSIGLQDSIVNHDRFAEPYANMMLLLPDDFVQKFLEERTQILSLIEEQRPELFNRLIIGVYSLYYTDRKVAAVIERLTGHSALPPQPYGHPLNPFEAKLVKVPSGRDRLYRSTLEADNA